MANYGLRIKDALGNIIIDIDERLNRNRYTTVADAGVSDSITLDDLTGITTVEMSWAINVTVLNNFPHEVSRSGNTISWNDPVAGTNIDSLIIVFIYV